MSRIYRFGLDDALEALEKRDYVEAMEKGLEAMKYGKSRTEMLAAMVVSLAAAIKDEETINNVIRVGKTA